MATLPRFHVLIVKQIEPHLIMAVSLGVNVSIDLLIADLQSEGLPESMSLMFDSCIYAFHTKEERITFSFGLDAGRHLSPSDED